MTILALEFSSSQRSVAVLREERDGRPARSAEVVESGGQSGRGVGMVDECLCQAQLEREEIECVAVGLGPGSYSGIRSAIALAQGWKLGSGPGTKLVGMSSVDCLAEQSRAEGLAGQIAFVIDAQRGEFYLACYKMGAAEARLIEPLRLVSRSEVQERERHGYLLAGPEITQWFEAGRVMYPRAESLGRLAIAQNLIGGTQTLEPIYLRETNFVKAPLPRVLPP